jgi:hypothetical protein
MKLLGISIIGKGNDPLYQCDCAKIAKAKGIIVNGGENYNDNDADAPAQQDYFEFGMIPETVPASRVQGDSLCVDHQFMMHASLDRLEELVGASKPDGTMPLRRNSFFSSWLGILVVHDGISAVYGYVTPTNIKFLALCEPSGNSEGVSFSETMTVSTSSSRSTAQLSETQQKIKTLLATLHQNYVHYIMNPFCNTSGPIESPTFDAKVRQAVAQYYDGEVEEPAKN